MGLAVHVIQFSSHLSVMGEDPKKQSVGETTLGFQLELGTLALSAFCRIFIIPVKSKVSDCA